MLFDRSTLVNCLRASKPRHKHTQREPFHGRPHANRAGVFRAPARTGDRGEIGAAARRARNEADLVAEVEKVLGLTDAELKEIQESLAELG